MTKLFAAILVVSLVSLAGCSSTGNKRLKGETENSVDKKIIKDKTNKNDIRKMFGSPTTVNFSNGNEIWRYEFSATSKDIFNYIPGINLLGSSTSIVNKSLIVTFNGNTVVDYKMIETTNSEKTGVFS